MPTNVLWLTADLPDSVHHGGVLRLVNLARELRKTGSCSLVVLNSAGASLEAIRSLAVFSEILTFSPPAETPRWTRQFRRSNARLMSKSYPAHFQMVVARLREHVIAHNVKVGIAFSLRATEILEALPCSLRVVDDYDCRTLTMERHEAIEGPPRGINPRLVQLIHYWRVRNLESLLTSRFDLVTTISAADQARLRELSRKNAGAVEILKNGVDEALLDFRDYGSTQPNSVVFWGNLEFRPNRIAVHYFFNEVYKPHLAARGICWHIVGPNADESIRRLAAQSENIKLAGFVPDLAAYVSRIPVVVNPLISGSGLKNKVLEAFALRRAVVSTRMGAEAIDATPGEHYLEAASAEEFAAHVLACLSDHALCSRLGEAAHRFATSNYRWEAIGGRLQQLLHARLELPRDR